MKTITRRISIGMSGALLTLFIALIILVSAIPVEAASSAKLSKKSLSLPVGAVYSIKVKNADSKVKWTTSNKKIASVEKTSGKNSSTARIIVKSEGSCYIKARVGKKTLKCKLTAKKASLRTSTSIFAFNILRESIKKDKANGKKGNTLVSPDSILSALAMTELGAKGKTKTEMERVLAGCTDAVEFNKNLSALHRRISGNKDISYSIANSIWIKKNEIDLKESFINDVKLYHGAGLFEEPFDESTVGKINEWVADNTKDMIKDVIDELTPADRMILVNAIAFEGQWDEPFGNPVKGRFTKEDGKKVKADMLYDTSNYYYFKLKGGKAFVKNYKGVSKSNGGVAFVGILPPKGKTVDSYLNSISGYDYIKAWDKKSYKKVSIAIPKFSYDYETSLPASLKKLGIKKAFSGSADFGKMFNPTEGTPNLCIDDVVHKTHIELDENGTKAAAVTAVIMKVSSALDPEEIIKIHLDRSFVYMLVDTKTGTPLFIGVLRTPDKR